MKLLTLNLLFILLLAVSLGSALLGKKSPLPGIPELPQEPDAEAIALDTVFDRDVDADE